jgi:thiamine biosynthesis lipoprotein
MKRRLFMQIGLGLLLGDVALLTRDDATTGLQWTSRTLTGMGTSMTIRVAHINTSVTNAALDASIAAIRHVEDQMSLFRSHSAINQLNSNGRLDHPHPDLVEILRIARQISERSKGTFDVTVQPLWLAFDVARKLGRLPNAQEVAKARASVGWEKMHVSDEAIWFDSPSMAITLNGIAQGFAADKVKAILEKFGIQDALIDTGEWAALGRPAAGRDWSLGVTHPRNEKTLFARLPMRGKCVATSADDQCTFSPDFANHHIFDPRTGYSPPNLASVTVAAPSCVMADAVTKVIFMSGFLESLELAKAWDVDVLVMDKNGHWQASPGLAFSQTYTAQSDTETNWDSVAACDAPALQHA